MITVQLERGQGMLCSISVAKPDPSVRSGLHGFAVVILLCGEASASMHSGLASPVLASSAQACCAIKAALLEPDFTADSTACCVVQFAVGASDKPHSRSRLLLPCHL